MGISLIRSLAIFLGALSLMQRPVSASASLSGRHFFGRILRDCPNPILKATASSAGHSNIYAAYPSAVPFLVLEHNSQQAIGEGMAKFDVLTVTVTQLRELLDTNTISSVEIVEAYLAQIDKHNYNGMKLRAMIALAPIDDILDRARKLDDERKTTGPRGPLHGIPIIVKDTCLTGTLGMGTTCGSLALKGAKTPYNAAVVDALIRAGMIIIGKANLSEWGAFKAERQRSGWSAVGGQGLSPYVRGGVLANATFLGHSTPCGSSSGSAVGVAAGFSPVAIGTETDGSIVQPTTRAGLYGLKCTLGSVKTGGISGISPSFDSLGAMARSSSDLANVLEVLMDKKGFSESLNRSWVGLSVGFVDQALWQPADFVVEPNDDFRKQTFEAIERAADRIEQKGGRVARPVPLISLTEACQGSGYEIEDLMTRDFRRSLETFLKHFTESAVRTLDELIDFNEKNADVEMPAGHAGQQALLGARDSNMTKEAFDEALGLMRSTARMAIDQTLDDNRIDVVLGPADARMASLAAVAGYPVASVPLGFANFNGRAFGMNMIARAGEEAKMLQVMSAWEQTFPEACRPPPQLVEWDSSETVANL